MAPIEEVLAEIKDLAAEETTSPQLRASTLHALIATHGNAERFYQITPEQIAGMADEEQAKLRSAVFWRFTKEQMQAIRGTNLRAAILNALAEDELFPGDVAVFTKDQIAAMPDKEQAGLSPTVFSLISTECVQSIKGKNLTAALLNTLAQRMAAPEILAKFTPKQMATLPAKEKRKLEPLTRQLLDKVPSVATTMTATRLTM